MTNTEHDILWKNGAKSLPDIAEQLDRIADQFKISNMMAILKEKYEIGELSKEEYSAELEGCWEIIEKL